MVLKRTSSLRNCVVLIATFATILLFTNSTSVRAACLGGQYECVDRVTECFFNGNSVTDCSFYDVNNISGCSCNTVEIGVPQLCSALGAITCSPSICLPNQQQNGGCYTVIPTPVPSSAATTNGGTGEGSHCPQARINDQKCVGGPNNGDLRSGGGGCAAPGAWNDNWICPVGECNTSCPSRNCFPKPAGTYAGSKLEAFNDSCTGFVQCQLSPGAYTETRPQDLSTVCGPYQILNFDACADVNQPLDVPPNFVQQGACKECVTCPTGICGASRNCNGNCPSCQPVTVTGRIKEATGFITLTPATLALHDPIRPFSNLEVFAVKNGRSVPCSLNNVVGNMTYTCTVDRPDGEAFNGQVDITVRATQYDIVTHHINYAGSNGAFSTNKDIYLVYAPQNNVSSRNYIKVRGASYSPRAGAGSASLANIMPIAPSAYDATDDVTPTSLIYGFNTAPTNVTNGTVITNVNVGLYSDQSVGNNWNIYGYRAEARDLLSTYLVYSTKRKITSYTPGMTVTGGSVVRLPSGNFPTDITYTPGGNEGVLFLVGTSGAMGDITIVSNLSPALPIAIIANKITVANTVASIKGILTANIVDIGTPTNQGLKIVGNLTALQTFTNSRKWLDTSKPSLYVVYDVAQPLAFLKLLSTATSTSQQEE